MVTACKKDLLSLPVETASGVSLGKISDIEVDVETHSINAYCVRRHILPRQLLGDANTLRIHPRQVRAITKKKMVVDDTAIPETEASMASATPSPSM